MERSTPPPSDDQPTQTRPADSNAPAAEKGEPLRSGTVLAERYEIVALAGRGGMGEVYRAHDRVLDQTVALKFLPRKVAHDETRLARLLDEVRIARQVSHPNVCRVYDVGSDEGRHFISMEWIEGQSLAAVLEKDGALPIDRALLVARQLCAGLGAAHDCRVVHRDLKPSNVLLDERGVARIADFGLAQTTAALRDHRAREGTPHYMSPEQLSGGEITTQSDLYSLGLLLYEIFTGKRAYGGRTLDEITQHRAEPPAPPSGMAPGIPVEVEQVILRCLAQDPSARPPDARRIGEALPGGGRFDEALAVAQQRADSIRAFRTEMAELRHAGLLDIRAEQMQAVDRHHDSVLRDLVQRFDVDVTERGKHLSLGMRVVSLVGALAMAASVFYFFFSVWGVIAVPVQIAILLAAPALALLATAVIAGRERTAYFTSIAAVLALACLVVDTVMIQSLYNVTPQVFSILAWGAFSLILAYGYRLRLMLAAGLAILSFFAAATLAFWMGGYWPNCLERPENLIPGVLVLATIGMLGPLRQPAGFASTYRAIGVVLFLAPVTLLSQNGFLSYLPVERRAIEYGYETLGLVASAGAIWLGLNRRWKETVYAGTLFFVLMLFLKFVDWWWDWMPRYLFFLVIALTAVLVLFALRRLRGALAVAIVEPPS